jgi:hypothetical protein
MFLFGSIDGIFRQQFHILATAGQIAATSMYNLNNVTAQFAFVDFK